MLALRLAGFATRLAFAGLQSYGAYCVARGGLRALAVHTRWAQALDDVNDIETIVASGECYESTFRDCVAGEQHDVVVLEDVCEGDGIAGDADDGSTDKRSSHTRGPSTRRLARKKMVHKVYEGDSMVAHKPFLGDVVAQARNVYNAGASDHYHRQLARAYMVRLMSAAGMRPAHINYHIDEMVVAVFLQTSRQLEAEEKWKSACLLGRIRTHRP